MAAPGPSVLRIKRKRDDDAPTALLVERQAKKQEENQEVFGKGVHETAFYYVRQTEEEDQTAAARPSSEAETTSAPGLFDAKNVQRRAEEGAGAGSLRGKPRMTSGRGVGSGNKERRTFHLKRPSTPEAGIKKRKARDGRSKEDGMPTFYEKRPKRGSDESRGQGLLKHARSRSSSLFSSPAGEEAPLKRPGRGVKTNGLPLTHTRTNSQMEAIANSLHMYAVDEASHEPPTKPKVTTMPKLSASRSRALHKQRASQNSIPHLTDPMPIEEDASSDTDYVYDTYVLAPTSALGATQVTSLSASQNVGYLIITEEDQSLWETYMEEEDVPSDENLSDDNDSNAEDWYGADYPDDELASDDELGGSGAYGYRAGKGGSDDEEWDEHTFSDDEYERKMNPFGKNGGIGARGFARFLKGKGDEEGEDSD